MAPDDTTAGAAAAVGRSDPADWLLVCALPAGELPLPERTGAVGAAGVLAAGTCTDGTDGAAGVRTGTLGTEGVGSEGVETVGVGTDGTETVGVGTEGTETVGVGRVGVGTDGTLGTVNAGLEWG